MTTPPSPSSCNGSDVFFNFNDLRNPQTDDYYGSPRTPYRRVRSNSFPMPSTRFVKRRKKNSQHENQFSSNTFSSFLQSAIIISRPRDDWRWRRFQRWEFYPTNKSPQWTFQLHGCCKGEHAGEICFDSSLVKHSIYLFSNRNSLVVCHVKEKESREIRNKTATSQRWEKKTDFLFDFHPLSKSL